MRRFGWTRLAYLLFVLTALTILVRLGDSGAEALSLSAETPGADEGRETQNLGRLTEGALSSLEDARAEVGGSDAPGAPGIVEPRVPPVPPVPATEEETGPTGQEATSAAGSSGGRGEAAGPNADPPVFYRPSGSGATFGSRSGSGPVCGDLGRFPESSKVVFPLEREYFYSYEDAWGAARPQGGHEGTDLMTPAGVPEYAVTDGTVVPVAGSNDDGWNTLGGYAVMVRADYSIGPVKKGDLFYYAHLERESPLPIGTRVRAGQVIGHSGDTGQGPEVTRGLFPPHLHLGWYDGTGGRSDVDSGAMNPYPLLEWIKSNGGAVSGGSDARYCEALGPRPSSIPWPDQNDPGVRPDLDTGSDDPKPSPVLKKKARKDATQEDAGEDAEKGNGPAGEPQRPEQPDKSPKGRPHDAPAKRPDANLPDLQKPRETSRPNGKPSEPARPDAEPPKQNRPGSGQSGPDKPKSPPPQSSGTGQGSQHDDASGGLTDAPGGTGPLDADQDPGSDPDSGDGAPAAGDEATGDEADVGESGSLEQYDSATGASPNVTDETPIRSPGGEREPEARPNPDGKPAR